MRILLTMLFCLITLTVVAETDYISLPIIRDIQKGNDNFNAIESLRVNSNAYVKGSLVVNGNVTASNNVTVSGVVYGQTNRMLMYTATLSDNVVTNETTPDEVGQILIDPAGSNVYIAVGTTTNNWVKLSN